jgi:hypothetical protein
MPGMSAVEAAVSAAISAFRYPLSRNSAIRIPKSFSVLDLEFVEKARKFTLALTRRLLRREGP